MTRVQYEQEYRQLVAKRLRMQRAALDLDQTGLAHRAEVTRDFVSLLERGAHGLDAWRLALLAEALGVSVGWLLDPAPGPVTVTSTPTDAPDSKGL